MPRRSRSRSPRRDRRRSRSPDRIRHRDRDRERERERRRSRSPPPPPPRYRSRSPRSPPRGRRSRSRSVSPRRRSPDVRGRSRERDGTAKVDKKPVVPERPEVDEEALAGLPPEEADMMRMMGFSSFDSTKGKKVEGNDIYVANVVRKRRYRQYMNRRGGFNRPLDFIA